VDPPHKELPDGHPLSCGQIDEPPGILQRYVNIERIKLFGHRCHFSFGPIFSRARSSGIYGLEKVARIDAEHPRQRLDITTAGLSVAI
jgi:hypothetical protein